MDEIVEPVLAITPNNTSLHVASLAAMLTHLSEAPPPTNEPAAKHAIPDADLYDSTGRRLTLHLGPSATDHVLIPTAELVAEDILQDRVRAALDNLQQLLTNRPEYGEIGPDEPRVTHIIQPQGSLADMLEALAQLFALQKYHPRDRGNVFHMLAHAAGIAHRR